MDMMALIGIVAALVVGVLLGVLLRSGALAAANAQAAELPPMRLIVDGLRDERDGALRDLAALKPAAERAAALEASLSSERARAEQLAGRCAAHERGEAEHQIRLNDLKEMEAKLATQFGELAGRALSSAQDQFLKRAEERFGQAGEDGAAKLRLLLTPVEATLKRYEEGLARVEKDRVGSYAELKEAVTQLTQGNEVVRREAARLANVMRSSPKARGRWGEEQLRTILESAGLAQNIDFSLQSSVSDGERQLRPDCIINLPGDRCIVVDVKNVWTAFEAAYDEEDEGRRAQLLGQHADAMKTTAADLARKGYWRQFDRSPDFVIMFIPGEHVLSAAAERAPELIETAYRQGVIIASTINMLALAKVMAGMWRQEQLAEQAQQIGALGKDLYARLCTMGGHISKLGRNLNLATTAYNDFVGSLESQVLTQARRFEALKVDTGGKAIDTLPVVETAVRPLTKLAALPDAAE